MKPLSAESQALINAARAAEAPPASAQAAVRAALDAKIAAGAGAVAAASAAGGAAKVGAGLAIKAVVASVAIGVTGVAVHHVIRERSIPAPPPVTALRAITPSRTIEAPQVEEVPMSRPPALRPIITPPIARASTSQPRAIPSPVESPVQPATQPFRPEPQPVAPIPSSPAPVLSTPLPVSPESSCDLSREMDVLESAERDLQAHDAHSALARLQLPSTSCPDLDQERKALRALALCGLGRTADARAVTEQLQREAPRSPSLARIHATCGF